MSARADIPLRPLARYTDAQLLQLRCQALAVWVGDGKYADTGPLMALNDVNIEYACRVARAKRRWQQQKEKNDNLSTMRT